MRSNMQLIVEALYLDLEDLEQCNRVKIYLSNK